MAGQRGPSKPRRYLQMALSKGCHKLSLHKNAGNCLSLTPPGDHVEEGGLEGVPEAGGPALSLSVYHPCAQCPLPAPETQCLGALSGPEPRIRQAGLVTFGWEP